MHVDVSSIHLYPLLFWSHVWNGISSAADRDVWDVREDCTGGCCFPDESLGDLWSAHDL